MAAAFANSVGGGDGSSVRGRAWIWRLHRCSWEEATAAAFTNSVRGDDGSGVRRHAQMRQKRVDPATATPCRCPLILKAKRFGSNQKTEGKTAIAYKKLSELTTRGQTWNIKVKVMISMDEQMSLDYSPK
ncbi:hypothetical protein E2562_018520 [Oryza meyeriana var. granulata]|uniref:Uncharacterized protein n=1 Tax=Oryza meyeriana var. granulata TaxID=110450 RepID=A0A6G1F994_9ORYZ|nr:hypothetical protein E2562_018520 [Oryza meyeriana var. granulata]